MGEGWLLSFDAKEYMQALEGVTLSTLTGRPNEVIRVEPTAVLVGTARSPQGKLVPLAEIQRAVDKLLAEGTLLISVESVGYRSAFVGAVLATLTGVRTELHPRRIILEHAEFLEKGVVDVSDLEDEGPQDDLYDRQRGAQDVAEALRALRRKPGVLSVPELWATLVDDPPGLYAWWVDQGGAQELTDGSGVAIAEGVLYAGQGGATQFPSGHKRKTGLRNRIVHMHLGNNVNFSTFRLSLAAVLGHLLELEVVAARSLHPASESTLSDWMSKHLSVAVHPVCDRDTLGRIEQAVLKRLDPPFNLSQMSRTKLRSRLSSLRTVITNA